MQSQSHNRFHGSHHVLDRLHTVASKLKALARPWREGTVPLRKYQTHATCSTGVHALADSENNHSYTNKFGEDFKTRGHVQDLQG